MNCSRMVARALKDAGVTCMFGLPGGEILDFIEAARVEGMRFILTRKESAAAFMADVTGQLTGVPGVCVATLGPGAINMTLGVANAFLDRSPVIAITAMHATSAGPYATHQNLDLNAVYRPFTKLAVALDGRNTAATIAKAIAMSLARRRGPVHIAIPSDIGRVEDNSYEPAPQVDVAPVVPSGSLDAVVARLTRARRPVALVGLDLDPRRDTRAVRAFLDRLNVPVFVTPKAKGIVAEDHPWFAGVCAGVSGDGPIVDFLATSDLLLGIGFEPVESDKLWHHTMPLVSVGPASIAAGSFAPLAEVVGEVPRLLEQLSDAVSARSFEWTREEIEQFRRNLSDVLRPGSSPRGLSGYEMTLRLRDHFPRHTIFTTDVGSVKMITSQAWRSYEPLTFFESNGLSAMSYALPAAMAARLQFPDRPILCTIGDGGFGMTLAEIETCVRERLHFITVVFNDSSLSLIDAAQQRRGYPSVGVRYGEVDFAAAAAAMGAWARRVQTMGELDNALDEARTVEAPVVIDAIVDPSEYVKQTAAPRHGGAR